MKKIAAFLIAGLLCCINLTALAENEKNISYKNQNGSAMDLTWHPGEDNTGTLTGTFTTAVGCKKAVGKPVPLAGYYNGNAVSIIINFIGCNTTVAMTGHLNKDNSELTTFWMLAKQSGDSEHAGWDSNIFGADTFTKK